MAKKIKKKAKKAYKHSPSKTVEELVAPLAEDLRDAWARLNDFLLSLGKQRTGSSAKAIMFYRTRCYAFVRPKKNYLELVFFLPEALSKSSVHRAVAVSKTKWANTKHLVHRDEVETPLTDWLAQAYEHGA